MGMRHQIPAGARLKVLTVSAKVRVTSEDRTDIEIEPSDRTLEVHDDGRVAEVRSNSTNLDIRVPHGLNVSAGTISGDVELRWRFGTVKVGTVSGHIDVDRAQGEG